MTIGTWNQPEEKLNQALENLRRILLEVKQTIETTEKQLASLEEQYNQVLKEAKSWQTLRDMSQNQGFTTSTQTAEKQFQEVRHQAILLKSRIKEKQQRKTILQKAWKKAYVEITSIQVANFEPLLEDIEQKPDTLEQS